MLEIAVFLIISAPTITIEIPEISCVLTVPADVSAVYTVDTGNGQARKICVQTAGKPLPPAPPKPVNPVNPVNPDVIPEPPGPAGPGETEYGLAKWAFDHSRSIDLEARKTISRFCAETSKAIAAGELSPTSALLQASTLLRSIGKKRLGTFDVDLVAKLKSLTIDRNDPAKVAALIAEIGVGVGFGLPITEEE